MDCYKISYLSYLSGVLCYFWLLDKDIEIYTLSSIFIMLRVEGDDDRSEGSVRSCRCYGMSVRGSFGEGKDAGII